MALTATISLAFGILGNVLSILVFSSPLPTFWRIFKRKSTENFKALPYICTLLSTALWSYYGLIKPGGTLILTINVAGVAFQSFYLILFLIYAPKKIKAKTSVITIVIDGVILGGLVIGTLFGSHGAKRVFIVGAICSTISVSMYAAPMVALGTVIRTKSVEYMPFFLSLFLFLNGGCWSLYAILVKDIFVEIPNAIGFVLGAIQLTLYVYYKNFAKKRKPAEEEMDDITTRKVSDVEMGRSSSLPKQFSSESNSTNSSIAKQESLPSKIIKTSSAKISELLNALQEGNNSNSGNANHGHERKS